MLDLYAGVGSMGLEAVSRGARSVLLVEQQRAVYSLLQQNIETLACADQATALMADALGTIVTARAPRPLHVVFIDPPYVDMERDASRSRILAYPESLRTIIDDQGWLVLRTPLDPRRVAHDIPGFDGPEVHKYGAGMWVLLYQHRSQADAE